MVDKEGFFKLAELVRLTANDVSRPGSWWESESVSTMLGIHGATSLEVRANDSCRAIMVRDDETEYMYLMYLDLPISAGGEREPIFLHDDFPDEMVIESLLYGGYCQIRDEETICCTKGSVKDAMLSVAKFLKLCRDAIMNDPRPAAQIFAEL